MLPRIEIRAIAPFSAQFSFVISGELAGKFRESYRIEWKNSESGGQASHWTTKVFDRGSFEKYNIAFTLFPGMLSNSGELISGKDIAECAEKLSNLAKPCVIGNAFGPSPLCLVRIGDWWAARGYFESVSLDWEGPIDESGYYTICHVSMVFDRHAAGYMTAARLPDLTRFSAQNYRFAGG